MHREVNMQSSADGLRHYHMEIDSIPIVLSCALSFLGSYAAITTFEQYRLCKYLQHSPKLFKTHVELIIIAILLGGVSIWTLHFVGMSSCILKYPDDSVTSPIYYRVDLTIASLIAVIVLCYAGIYISTRDDFFIKDRTDAIADFYEKSSALSIQDVRRQGKYAFLTSTLFYNMFPLCMGGLFTSLGVCVMHYIGMVAMTFNGEIIWNEGIIAASVLIALVASTAAYWILFRLLVVFPSMELLRVASAFIAMIAVSGMHYTGMAAATFVYKDANDAVAVNGSTLNLVPQQQAMYGAIVAGVCLSFLAVAFALNDLRSWYISVARVMRELDMRAEPTPASTSPGTGPGAGFDLASPPERHGHGTDAEAFLQLYRTLRCKTRSGKQCVHNKVLIQARLDAKRQLNSDSSQPSDPLSTAPEHSSSTLRDRDQHTARNATVSQQTQTSPTRKWSSASPNKQAHAPGYGQAHAPVACIREPQSACPAVYQAMSPSADHSKAIMGRVVASSYHSRYQYDCDRGGDNDDGGDGVNGANGAGANDDGVVIQGSRLDCADTATDKETASDSWQSHALERHLIKTMTTTTTATAEQEMAIMSPKQRNSLRMGRPPATIYDDIDMEEGHGTREAMTNIYEKERFPVGGHDIEDIENQDLNMSIRVSPRRMPMSYATGNSTSSGNSSSGQRSLTTNSLFCSTTSPSPSPRQHQLQLQQQLQLEQQQLQLEQQQQPQPQQQRFSFTSSSLSLLGSNYPKRQSFPRNSVIPIDVDCTAVDVV